MPIYWMSFVADGTFRGAYLTEAPDETTAFNHVGPIHPDTEVAIWEMPETPDAREEIARWGLDTFIPAAALTGEPGYKHLHELTPEELALVATHPHACLCAACHTASRGQQA
jgi:hypothetical protein